MQTPLSRSKVVSVPTLVSTPDCHSCCCSYVGLFLMVAQALGMPHRNELRTPDPVITNHGVSYFFTVDGTAMSLRGSETFYSTAATLISASASGAVRAPISVALWRTTKISQRVGRACAFGDCFTTFEYTSHVPTLSVTVA